MTPREALDGAIGHAGQAPRNDASKWRQLKDAFTEQFSTDGVTGTLLTDEKQLKTRMVEIESRDPNYVVLSIVANGDHVVRPERVREWLAKPNLPSARCALIVEYDEQAGAITPLELQEYQSDPVAQQLAAAYGLPIVPISRQGSTPSNEPQASQPKGLDALGEAWHAKDVLASSAEWDELREAAIPEYREVLDGFLAGDVDVHEFRSRIDSLSKTKSLWGFRGTGQMFFNQLVKAAYPSELTQALRAALTVPVFAEDAEAKLEVFLVAVDSIRERAQTTGATPPGRGRINFFVSFFWELVDRENWAVFYPNSRNLLEKYGLLDTSLPQPQLYTAYNKVMQELKELLETTTWGAEHLLWQLGQGAEEEEASEEGEETPDLDLYASYRAQELYFPDEIVTSLVLSLATKRFVILGGISGTGKTQIALGLARYLDQVVGGERAEFEPPVPDESTLYVELTGPRLRRARTSLDKETRARFDAQIGVPERGSSKHLRAKLPDGSVGRIRLYNAGFQDESRRMVALFFLEDVRDWLNSEAKPGEYLRVDFSEASDADVALSVVRGEATGETVPVRRHELVAVRSDWTDPRGLLGFFNPLTSSYSRTAVVDLLLRAAEDLDHPYIVVLDEMNLARVEYYFSDFLSALESGEPIQLMSPGVEDELTAAEGDEVPAELEIPSNVSFIGTVNVDETTHAFSPKVLDRANVIEFSDVDVERALGFPVSEEGSGLRLKDGGVHPAWLCTSRAQALEPTSLAHAVETFTEALEDVHHLMARFNRQFGYRVLAEVSAFVGHALEKTTGDAEDVVRRAFDLQLRQKIIPKLSGGRELEELVTLLLDYCLTGAKTREADVAKVRRTAQEYLDPGAGGDGKDARYPSSAAKLLRMLEGIADAGFVGALE